MGGKTAKIWALWERNSIQSSHNQSADGKTDAASCHILSQSVDGKTDVLSLQSRKSVDGKTNVSFHDEESDVSVHEEAFVSHISVDSTDVLSHIHSIVKQQQITLNDKITNHQNLES